MTRTRTRSKWIYSLKLELLGASVCYEIVPSILAKGLLKPLWENSKSSVFLVACNLLSRSSLCHLERSRDQGGSEYGRSVTVLLFSIAGDFSASLTAYAVRFGRNDIKKWQYRLLKRGRGDPRPPANLALRSYFTKKIIPRKRTVQGFPLGTSAVGGDEGLSFTSR